MFINKNEVIPTPPASFGKEVGKKTFVVFQILSEIY